MRNKDLDLRIMYSSMQSTRYLGTKDRTVGTMQFYVLCWCRGPWPVDESGPRRGRGYLHSLPHYLRTLCTHLTPRKKTHAVRRKFCRSPQVCALKAYEATDVSKRTCQNGMFRFVFRLVLVAGIHTYTSISKERRLCYAYLSMYVAQLLCVHTYT